jgi:hypothetical protein
MSRDDDETEKPGIFDQDVEELKQKNVDKTDFKAESERAFELLDELTTYWDDLDRGGRVMRMRNAELILEELMQTNQERVELEHEHDRRCECGPTNDREVCSDCGKYPTKRCPDCGSFEKGSEDIGHGKVRGYCKNCDFTFGV